MNSEWQSESLNIYKHWRDVFVLAGLGDDTSCSVFDAL